VPQELIYSLKLQAASCVIYLTSNRSVVLQKFSFSR